MLSGSVADPTCLSRIPRVAIKKPTQKKQTKKHLKNPLKMFFLGFVGFLKILIFYENNTNFCPSNRFFTNKKVINYHLFTKK
jgi:hypothetical protein